MFARIKRSGGHEYVQIVENHRQDGRVRQTVIATLGRRDLLQAGDGLESLMASLARLTQHAILVAEGLPEDRLGVSTWRIGGPLVFQRLWEETGCQEIIQELLGRRNFEFPLERILFASVLQRIFEPGSDRACTQWLQGYRIPGLQGAQLHHWYRAMGWLGEALPPTAQRGALPFGPRTTKDLIEEALFQRGRDLLTEIDVAFFDTTTLFFEGEGGDSVGARGHNKDGHPELKQMIVGVVMDSQGNPLCCEMWPGNTSDVTTLVPIADRLRRKFHVRNFCIVADRGMISEKTIADLEARGLEYILGARMRSTSEVKDQVLSRAGRYQIVHSSPETAEDPSGLQVKEVWVDDHRYVVCRNPDQAKRDEAVRAAILESLEKALTAGEKSLVGNRGYRRYLRSAGQSFAIDEGKVAEEKRYDGKWVLRTNTTLPSEEVALRYKQLWTVEALFRTMKSVLDTRPIFHKVDETICGHVFCSFLALKLMTELRHRLEAKHVELEWGRALEDLEVLAETELVQDDKRFLLRSALRGDAGKLFQATGVRIPPTIRLLSPGGGGE
jgi:transposase